MTAPPFHGPDSHYWGTIFLFIFMIILGFTASTLERRLLFLAGLSLSAHSIQGLLGPYRGPQEGPDCSWVT